MRSLRNASIAILLGLLSAPCLLAAAAALLGQLGRWSLAWDVLNHFAPIWLAGSLAGVALGLMVHGRARWLVCAFCLAGATASASTIAPEYLRDTGRTAPTGVQGLKIVQFNGWFGNPQVRRVLAFLREEDPDIVVLQEVSPPVRAALRRQRNWAMSCPDCEVVILTKQRPFAVARIGTATRVRLHGADGDFTMIGVHNAWPTDADQVIQETRLASLLAEETAATTIVAGDFNSTPWSFARRRWDHVFGLLRRDRGVASWPTGRLPVLNAPAPIPLLPIDHVYAGDHWATEAVRRGPRGIGSDHYPLIVTLSARVADDGARRR
ncbi:endonuclease/exonuclease/phosphatase family protein [Phenylobacterium immobile]|uniref:endonuclease/exonuclease/phosphatase family protein n=1 Tax=Phenylobacterium immobile TaxID=21 RepID=UPI000A4E4D50|nr:endonuclease/exonuclease/phosphatase family protein [Phenylobacterium immobile]